MASLSFINISAGTGSRLVFRPIYPQVVIPVAVPEPTGGGTSKRKRRKYDVIHFSDLDERERREALARIPVKPFTPLEQAGYDIEMGEYDEDDEIILMALMRILH